jgi:acylphosphatase
LKNPELKRLHAIVKGQVQGVGFRAFVVDVANRMEVHGWVRNRWDGSVELVAEADQSVLEQFLGRIRQGPRMSNVMQVLTDWEEAEKEFSTFSARSTI